MKLKEMENTWVKVNSPEDVTALIGMYDGAGWKWCGSGNNSNYVRYVTTEGYPQYVTVEKYFGTHYGQPHTSITLAEFKKEQGIMKYSAGDVLVKGCGDEATILGVCGRVYFRSTIHSPDISRGQSFTEYELDEAGWSLKTETTKTDMSVSEIEKALGKAAGSLNVVADNGLTT